MINYRNPMCCDAPEVTAEAESRERLERFEQKLGEDFGLLPRSEQFDRLEARIGNTPILDAACYNGVEVWSKLELSNPSGSHYDRAFVKTIRTFEEEGLIRPGDELRDITSGSGGISLALLGHVLGYNVRLTTPSELPTARVAPMNVFGAVVVDAGPGYMQTTSQFQAAEIAALKANPSWQLIRPTDKDQRAFVFDNGHERICYLNHSENTLSPQAFRAIGHEMVAAVNSPTPRINKPEQPEAVLLALGNWTTVAGIAPVIREAWPETTIIGYEGENRQDHNNFGTSVDGIPLRFRNDALIDKKVTVSDVDRDFMDDVFNRDQHYLRRIGHSSLLGYAAAIRMLEDQPSTKTVFTIAYDNKFRY